MKEVCILKEMPSKILRKRKIFIQEINEPLLNVKLNIYNIPTRKNKFKASHIKNIISTYNYIYTNVEKFKIFEKKSADKTLMSRLYKQCFLTLTKKHSIDKDNESIAILVKKDDINALCELCSIIRFPILYNCSEETANIISERTGVCAPTKNDVPTQNFKVIIDSNISFIFNDIHYTEVTLKLPQKLQGYKDIPIYDIFADYIKLNEEITHKDVKVKIAGFTALDKSEII